MASDHTASPSSPVRAASVASGISPIPTWIVAPSSTRVATPAPTAEVTSLRGAANDGRQFLIHFDGHVNRLDV